MRPPTPQTRLDALPPLPETLRPSADDADPEPQVATLSPIVTRMLAEMWPAEGIRTGCYLLNYTPAGASKYVTYDGTLRVERQDGGFRASGDFYSRKVILVTHPPYKVGKPILDMPPDPADGIPIFPRDQYASYLETTDLRVSHGKFDVLSLSFREHRFDAATRGWTPGDVLTAHLRWMTAPPGYPYPDAYLEGDVVTQRGTAAGRLTMGWVSPYLRRARVEIDRVSASETPLDNGAGVNWRTIFDAVGWDVTVQASDTNVPEPSGDGWSEAELHAAMLEWRAACDLDKEWRYHLLCIRQLDTGDAFGLMYDSYGGDTNDVPREGAAVCSHRQLANEPLWGDCAGQRFGQSAAAYFRTAVHEIGHAIMMFHPVATTGNHIMQITGQIAGNAVPPDHFPHNIQWAFSPEDQRRLRHLPDVVVRPGTVLRFDTDVSPGYTGVPISAGDLAAGQGLQLTVSPILDCVPIGAPVRVDFRVVNAGEMSVPFPVTLNIKAGHVTGRVIDPSGVERPFAPIVRYLDGPGLGVLAPNESAGDSLTLLRGCDGALFGAPGYHRIAVTVTWDVGGVVMQISGEAGVMITAAVDEAHSKAALRLIATPDVLLSLAVGGDHHVEGNAAIRQALDNPVLRPHFAYIEAKRLLQPSRRRAADIRSASALIAEDTVLSTAERKKLAKAGVTIGREAPVGVGV